MVTLPHRGFQGKGDVSLFPVASMILVNGIGAGIADL